jgi:prephenate dehydratase/chorismate mutase
MSAKENRRVAFQGEHGAFTEGAAQAWFGDDVETLPRHEFRDVVTAVQSGEALYGVLPVENSLYGSVGAALDALLETDLEIVGEVIRPIRMCLLGVPGATVEGVKKVFSQPPALGQIQRFLASRPDIEAVAVHDTAGAARMVGESGDRSTAAIASETAARHYGLTVLARDIQDRADNSTRFYVVTSPERVGNVPELKAPKSLVVFETGDRPGALVEVLQAFARRGLNLSRLESRPGRLPWTYRFVAEVMADMRTGEGAVGLDDVRSRAMTVVVRGPFGAAAGIAPEDKGAADVPIPEMEPWQQRLDRTRQAINDVDEALIQLLAERMRLARRAQALRTEGGAGGVDPGREAKVLRLAGERARKAGLPEEPVRDVYWRIVALCTPKQDT